MNVEYSRLIISFVIVAFIIFLLFILSEIRKITAGTKVIDYDRIKVDANMAYSCPKCNTEMEKGFIMAGRGMIWRNEREKPTSIFSTVFKCLDNTINFTMSTKENRAWRCQSCKYVLIDYNALVGKISK